MEELKYPSNCVRALFDKMPQTSPERMNATYHSQQDAGTDTPILTPASDLVILIWLQTKGVWNVNCWLKDVFKISITSAVKGSTFKRQSILKPAAKLTVSQKMFISAGHSDRSHFLDDENGFDRLLFFCQRPQMRFEFQTNSSIEVQSLSCEVGGLEIDCLWSHDTMYLYNNGERYSTVEAFLLHTSRPGFESWLPSFFWCCQVNWQRALIVNSAIMLEIVDIIHPVMAVVKLVLQEKCADSMLITNCYMRFKNLSFWMLSPHGVRTGFNSRFQWNRKFFV